MIDFFKGLPAHFKTAWLSIVRHFAMSLSASSAVMITLILFSAFLIVAGNVSLFTDSIENDIRIHAVLDKKITKKDDINRVKNDIEALDNIKKIIFSDAKNELEMMIKEKGKEFSIYRGKENPLSHAFFISIKNSDNLKATTAQISAIPGVKEAVYGGTSVSKMIAVLNSIRSGGFIFVILLTLLAIFLISNSIKMTIYARNSEIAIMRTVGASNTYIKIPFMIEGMLIGFMGSIIPCILTYFGYQYLYHSINGQIVSALFSLEEVLPFALIICGVLIISGMLVGIFGSFISTSRYLRWKR